MTARSRPLLALAVCLLAAAARADTPADDPEQLIQDLYAKNKLFTRAEYKAVRAAFAKRFEHKYRDQIQRAFGDDHDALTAWLNDNADIKEEFFTALDEKHDDVPAALRLFREIYKKYPDKLKTYASLAIATAVTWDTPGPGVYDYAHHQRRTKSTLPEGAPGALENFQYVLDNESAFQGRAQHLPWEFLTYVVNHKTPLDERKWAIKNYGKGLQFKECYKHVPYDHGMLEGKTPKLAGLAYTLENLRSAGGVCAMQADFASRVGKSLCIPAHYIRGEANNGVLHAWVMWVELKQVTKTEIRFSLESYGRYQEDKYYTGTLYEPQTGREILDRDMELRLTTVGQDRQARRHAALAMRAFPLVKAKQDLDAAAQVAYLDKAIALCPGYEEGWLALARLARGGTLPKGQVPAVMGHVNKVFTTFSKFPDFSWKVTDDLLTVQEDAAQRNKVYERLVALYEGASRPDLACQARLKLADLLMKDDKHKEAATGLAHTIQKFPDEGRYVPKMMAKLEEACKGFKGGGDVLQRFYLDTLPRIPTKRGDEPSKYCIGMYEKAITFFKGQNQEKVVEQLQRQLQKIKAGA